MRYFGDKNPTNYLFRPVQGLPNKAIFDTNILLDIIFIADGIGISIFKELKKLNYQLYVTHNSTIELNKILHKIGRKEEEIFIFNEIIKNSFIIIEHPISKSLNVNKSDLHIACGAISLDAFVITDDIPLNEQLNNNKIHSRTSREVIFSFLKNDPAQELMVFGQGIGADGHFFLKFTADKEMILTERLWYLFESSSLGALFYDSKLKSLTFSNYSNEWISLDYKIIPDVQYTLLLNFSTGTKTHLNLKISDSKSLDVKEISGSISAFETRPKNELIVFDSYQKNEGWKGNLQNFSFGQSKLNSETWNACRRIIGLYPPNLTSDLLLYASTLTEIGDNYLIRPNWKQVVTLANVCIPEFYPGTHQTTNF